MADESTSLTHPVGSRGNLKQLLELNKESIAAVIPSYLTPEKVLKVVMFSAMTTPELLECTRESILQSVMISAQMGIPIGPQSGHLVPFNRKIKGRDGVPDRWVKEAIFIPDYRGLIAQAKRCSTITKAEAILVHQDDVFEVDWGNEAKPITHKPNFRSENRDSEHVIAGYFRAKLPDGDYQYEVMTRKELEAIRDRSKAKDAGPWKTDTSEMYKKTVTKRGMKYIPSLDERVNIAIEHDNQIEAGNLDVVGLLTDLNGAKDVTAQPSATVATEQTKSKMESVATQVAAERQKQEQTKPAQQATKPQEVKEEKKPGQQSTSEPVTTASTTSAPPAWAAEPQTETQTAPATEQPISQPPSELPGGKGKIIKDVQFPARMNKESEAEAATPSQLAEAQKALDELNQRLGKNFMLNSTVKNWFGIEITELNSATMACIIQVITNWK
jgi:phage RecT family recombinase